MLLNVTLSVELCHWMLPVFPDKVTVVLPETQNEETVAVAVPPTEVEFTVIVCELESVHPPPVAESV